MAQTNFTHQAVASIKPSEKRQVFFDSNSSGKGLGLRVTKTGTKTFFYRYRFQGKLRRYTIGRFPDVSLAEARKRVGELRTLVNRGIDPHAEKQEKKRAPQSETFAELAEEFKTKYLPTLKEKTQSEYKRIIDKELIPVLGSLAIENIEKSHIVTLLDKKAYKDDAPTMANRIRARLSRIFTFGMERGLADRNPVQMTSKYKSGENSRDRYYSEKEIKNLWKFFEKQNEPTQSVLKMLLICGQRKTETMQLSWDHISNNVWTIPKELAKNNKPHEVPLPSMAQSIINKMKEINGDTDYVFCSPKKDNEPISWLTRARRDIQKNSNVKDFRPHDLRRTVATYMAKLGVERTTLGKILNHKGLSGDSQITAIYDRHGYQDEKKEALEKWNTCLKEILYSS